MLTLLWGGQEACRPPWAHRDHGALGRGLSGVDGGFLPFMFLPRAFRGRGRSPELSGRCLPWPQIPLESAPRSCEGTGGWHLKARRCYKCPPTSQMFCPQQDPWQGRQPPPPHLAEQKSLNSGLRKVFVQLVTQEAPFPAQGEHRGRGGQGRVVVWAHLASRSASVPHSWGSRFI